MDKKLDSSRRGFSLIELLVAMSIIAILASILMPALSKNRESARRSACVSNLKQIGLALSLYINENRGEFPPLDGYQKRMMFDGDMIYPEYVANAGVMACPSDSEYDLRVNFRLTQAHPDGTTPGQVHPDCISPLSYLYFSHLITEDDEMLAAIVVYTWIDTVLPISNNVTNGWRGRAINLASFGFTGSGNAGSSTLHRLAAGVDRFLLEDINTIVATDQSSASSVPLMWDQISTNINEFNHVPAGQNVLYLDSHVAFVRYDLQSTKFPSSPMYAAVNGAFKETPSDYCP